MDADRPLTRAFLAAASPAVAAALEPHDRLEAELAALVERARAERPTLAFDANAFAAHVARALGAGDPNEAPSLAIVHAGDLSLACACAAGDANAMRELEKFFGQDVDAAIARIVSSHAQRQDLVQALREKLLVAPRGESPKIAAYSGRGPLAGWIRVAAVRLAISAKRLKAERAQAPSESGDEPLFDATQPLGDPELEHVRLRYASDFRAAFQDALARLSAEDRNLLRVHLVDGLNIDQIGVLFRVHRATAARRIARVRETVRDETKRLLAERLRLNETELESLVAVLRSQLDVSIHRLLRTEHERSSPPEPIRPPPSEPPPGRPSR